MGGKSSAPDAPNYAAAAKATAAGDLENARYTTLANRPDIYTPLGSQTWEVDPENPDKWTGYQNLNPEAQKAFDLNQKMQTGLGELGNQAIGSVGDLFNTTYTTPGELPDYRDPGTYGDYRQQVMDAMLSRVNTDISRDRDTTRAQLVAAGIPVGSEAFQREMEQIDRKQTDARQQAEIAAQQQATQEYAAQLAGSKQLFGADTQNYQQAIKDALLERQTPLNEISAFRTGSQVQQPQFQPYGQQQFTGGPDLLGAATAQYNAELGGYNAQQAGTNNLMSGLFTLGAAGIGAYPWAGAA